MNKEKERGADTTEASPGHAQKRRLILRRFDPPAAPQPQPAAATGGPPAAKADGPPPARHD
jgi:hypothetical protein